MKKMLRFEGAMQRFEWLAWLLLVLSLGLGLGQGIDAGDAPVGVSGAGNHIADVTMTLMVCVAAMLQCWTQFQYPDHGTRLERYARWLMLGVSTVLAFRFSWLLLIVGDIFAPMVTVIAFMVYSMAQAMHSIAIVGLERTKVCS